MPLWTWNNTKNVCYLHSSCFSSMNGMLYEYLLFAGGKPSEGRDPD